jgi:hypothetical protein
MIRSYLCLGTIVLILLISCFVLNSSCYEFHFAQESVSIHRDSMLLCKRFGLPENYERVDLPDSSFGSYLRNLALKPFGTPIKTYTGELKSPQTVHEAVINMEIGNKDLQQCADAVIRLRAEYLYKQHKYIDIHFDFTNGDRADFIKYAEGYRLRVHGNQTIWEKKAERDYSYPCFRRYLDMVFTYAGSLSLSQELKPVDAIKNIMPGDVFIKGGSPGHAVIVLDVAQNRKTGEKIFILGQSYMPAQDIHVLKNPSNAAISPWYNINFGESLVSPEWTFSVDQLMRF